MQGRIRFGMLQSSTHGFADPFQENRRILEIIVQQDESQEIVRQVGHQDGWCAGFSLVVRHGGDIVIAAFVALSDSLQAMTL